MNKKIVIALAAILILLLGSQFYRHAYGLGITEDETIKNDNFVDGTDLYVITNTAEGGFLIKADNETDAVAKIIDIDSYAVGTRACHIINSNGPCVLVGAKSVLDDEIVDVYNILHFDKNGRLVNITNWFTPDRISTLVEATSAADGFMLYFLSEDEKYVYSYAIEETQFRELDRSYLQDRREVTALELTDVMENTGEHDFDAMAQKGESGQVFGKLKLSASDIAKINHTLMINYFTALVIGLVLLILLYIVLKRKNRVAYLILIWEIMLCTFISIQSTGLGFLAGKSGRITVGIIGFIIFSCLGISVILLRSSDLSLLLNAMNRLALGDTEIRKPKTIGEDMDSLWNGLLDVCRIIRNVNYKRFKLYENYYRFAPKNIEAFLGKKSISEIVNGDAATVRGNVAVIRYFAQEDKTGCLAQVIDIISGYQENGLCSLVGCMTDLSTMTIAFTPDCKDSVAMLSNIVRASGKAMSVFVHNIEYTYGIVGNEKQQIPYIVSKQLNELKTGSEVFEYLRLGLVITKEVDDLDEVQSDTRFIGCTRGDNPARLYEVLDVLDAGDRRDMKNYDDIFQKGLSLIEARDYYLARNEFARIIKKNPSDNVAKWYLFRAEKFLNEGNADDNYVSII